ncbi:diguanylate cyclase [Shewanella sp. AS1]|uniref:diguanylate cyclase n=1 Tax=Shewanella sp. AS1 TaxID=2907626 RepID=UPI001F19C423|nr:diguanylate cyclase [Shewanella sp. AS1]MCE9680514.1 diguanylate cyclase [Shewanella sp. AS1]
MEKLAVVLVVDDARANLLVIKQCLSEHYQVWTADNRQACLVAAKRHPDLILLNTLMPDLDGYQVCRQLKANPDTADIPIIFVTATESDESIKGLALGAVDCIAKPIHPAVVRARVSAHIQLKQHLEQLKFISLHDKLTGLYNRHFFIERANQALASMVRHNRPLCLMMIDLDKFNQINNFNGRDVGDLVLQQVSELLQRNFRREDTVARLGGKTFVILMELDIYRSQAKAELVRQRLQTLRPLGIEVTASLGVVSAQGLDGDFSHLLALAEEAVLRAKADGRNCLVSRVDGHYVSSAP